MKKEPTSVLSWILEEHFKIILHELFDNIWSKLDDHKTTFAAKRTSAQLTTHTSSINYYPHFRVKYKTSKLPLFKKKITAHCKSYNNAPNLCPPIFENLI